MTTTLEPPSTVQRRGFAAWLVILLVIAIAGGGLLGALTGLRSTTSPVLAAPASVLGWEPGVPRGVPLSGPLTVYFSRPMDRASVESTWHLVPRVTGSFTWSDTSVSFRPTSPLRPSSSYRLTVGPGALDDQHKHLQNPLAVTFETGTALSAQNVMPAPGSTGVPVNGLIAVSFNHPMVALAGLEAPQTNPPGWRVSISPQTPGNGSWLGTSTWVFRSTALRGSSLYSVTVAGPARDAWGEPLGHDLHWTFRTVTPAVIGETPASGRQDANPDGLVSVTFNQPMDPTVTGSAFTLQADGQAVPGAVSWSGNTLRFSPTSQLDPTRHYTALIGAGALSANHLASLGRTVSWSFRVAPPPRVVSTTPHQGATVPYPSVQLNFSAPMNQTSLDRHLTVSPSLDFMNTYLNGPQSSSSNTYEVDGNFRPSTSYTVTIGAGARDSYGRRLAQPYTLTFSTGPLTPSVMLYGPTGAGTGITFSAGRVMTAPIQFMNESQVHYRLVKTSLTAPGSTPTFSGGLNPPPGTTVRDWTESVPSPLNQVQNQRVQLANADGSALAPGVYWLGAQGSPATNQTPSSSELVVAANANITLKSEGRWVLAWVTSASTGKPVSGVTVTLLDNNDHPFLSGATGGNGLRVFHLSNDQGIQGAEVEGAYVGVALNNWQAYFRSAYPMNPGEGYGYTGPPTGAYAYTDRPIYRPGQTVYFRAIVWKDNDGVYRRPGSTLVQVTANNISGHGLYGATLTPDGFGSINGRFKLPMNAPTGPAYLTLQSPALSQQYAETNFSIAEYRKPEFLTTVSSPRPSYVQGEPVRAIVSVNYVFGAVAAGQQVAWTAYSQPRFSQPPGWEAYQFGDQSALQELYANPMSFGTGGPFGKEVAHGAGATDDQGELSVELPASMAASATDQTITVEATATDINHQAVTGRVQVPDYKSATQVGLAPSEQVVPVGRRETIGVAAASVDGSPIGNLSLTAMLFQRTYSSRLANSGVGQPYWQQVPHDQLVTAQQISTSSDGKASFSFTSRSGGSYYAVVQGKDATGNVARGGVIIYASAEGYSDWGATTNTELAIQPDRNSYSVGQTAHILVAAPFANSSALITVERGTVRSYRVTHFSSTSPSFDLPITLADIPNVYVTVALYRGWRGASPPDFRYGLAPIHVNVTPRKLVVHVSQDRASYHPGNHVRYTITTTDARGRPVPAQLSLALVDTAVLALQDEVNPDIVQAMYGQRPLNVATTSGGFVSVDRMQAQPNFQISPGGGGGGGGGGPGAPTIYKHFNDTAYWSANVETDATGQASITVKLPDNFTTWRLDARGVTAQQQVGQAKLFTVSTRDIVVRPVTPRFFLQGDSLRVGVVVNDDLAEPVTAAVSLSATGLTVSGGAKTVTIPAHGERLVLWNASVPASSSAVLTVRVSPSTAGVQAYGVQVHVPVYAPLTDETVATSGQVFGTVKQYVMLPGAAASSPGSLTIEVSSSLIQGIGRALAAFTPQSYESNDDVASRLLVATALRRLPRSLTGLSAARYANLPRVIAAAASKLESDELSDGGWPWFNGPGAQSSVLISADAVQALGGYSGGSAATGHGQAYLRTILGKVPAAERAYVLLVLARSGGADKTDSEALFHDTIARAALDPAAIADLAWALSLSGDRASAMMLVAQLDTAAMVSATGAHWEGAAGGQTSPIATTASVLGTLQSLTPHDPFVPAAARWLMLARQGNAWDCSRDSALAIDGLAAYARSAREGNASYSYVVSVNGAVRNQGSFPGRHGASVPVTIPVGGLRRPGLNTVTLVRASTAGNNGKGNLYYVARLHYYLKASAIAARDEGVSVSRRYLDLHGRPLQATPAGTLVQVELTLHTGQTLQYLDVQDPLPAGLEVLDKSLNTSQQGIFPEWTPIQATPEISSLYPYLSHTDLLDDRVALYAVSLPPGAYRYTYLAQATSAGSFEVAPTHASETFFPEVFGRSAGQIFTVR